MKRILMLLGVALALTACGTTENAETGNEETGEIKLYGAKVATAKNQLPTCDSTLHGQLFYTLDSAVFYFCSELGYIPIDLKGTDGTNGTNGANGVNGVNGTNGKDGQGCVVKSDGAVKTITCGMTSATVTDGESCTVETTLAGYDLTCGGKTFSIANGKDGKDGKDGEDGEDGTLCTVVDDGQGTVTQTCGTTTVSWPKAMCGGVSYEPTAYLCSEYQLIPKANTLQCGSIYYDPNAYECLESVLVSKAQIKVCGGKSYNSALFACLENKIVDKATVEFCAEVAYDPDLSLCENDVVIPRPDLNLCNGVTFDPNTSFCDKRDGQTYTYGVFGGVTWMTRNLNYKHSDDEGSYCYNNIESNCATYGRLYNWSAARLVAQTYQTTLLGGTDAGVQGVCPDGWHLPSASEWSKLASIWNTEGTRFAAQKSGEYFSGAFGKLGVETYYQVATEANSSGAKRYYIIGGSLSNDSYGKSNGNAVRCVKNASVD